MSRFGEQQLGGMNFIYQDHSDCHGGHNNVRAADWALWLVLHKLLQEDSQDSEQTETPCDGLP